MSRETRLKKLEEKYLKSADYYRGMALMEELNEMGTGYLSEKEIDRTNEIFNELMSMGSKKTA